jgi:histidinol-phosphatase (PHP family)
VRVLPADDHVHTEWSWDAPLGSMERTCARAVELGLPSVSFTDHAEFVPRSFHVEGGTPDHLRAVITDGVMHPPELDVEGYLESLERCRAAYPGLRIRSGVELSEPHRHPEQVADLTARGGFERVLASVHSLPMGGGGTMDVASVFAERPVDEVVRDYLAEAAQMVETSADFEVLAHIDFPIRYLPAGGAAYDPGRHEDDHRRVLRALAGSERVLEVNTKVPLHPRVLDWWRDEGGRAITFASDAHRPDALATGFAEAVEVAQAAGFRVGSDPLDVWVRS